MAPRIIRYRHSRRAAIAGVAGLIVLALASARPLTAADPAPQQKLDTLRRELAKEADRQAGLDRRARDIAVEIERLRRQSILAAAGTQKREAALTGLESDLARLNATAAAKENELRARENELSVTLGALERLARHPPVALVAVPRAPVEIARSMALLRSMVPTLEERAARLRVDIDTLEGARAEIGAQRLKIAAETESYSRERRRLSSLLLQRATLHRAARSESRQAARRAERVAAEAKDLKDLIGRLAAAKEPPRPGHKPSSAQTSSAQTAVAQTAVAQTAGGGERIAAATPGPASLGQVASLPKRDKPGKFSTARGRLILPARGRIVRRFAGRDAFGAANKGITIETRPTAQVVAPYEGRVVFAGKFRHYGRLLIIAHGEGYHTLLAGLSDISSTVGQRLLAGEPVGGMGRPERGKPMLYVELRRKGRPIDPRPWLITQRNKANG